MKFPKEDLLELLYGGSFDDYEFISNKITGNSRWSVHHTLVFKHKEDHYRVRYSSGATEYQAEYPFDNDPDEVECEEVIPVEIVTTEYRKKDA